MDKDVTIIILLLILAFLLGCAAQSGWAPTIDTSKSEPATVQTASQHHNTVKTIARHKPAVRVARPVQTVRRAYHEPRPEIVRAVHTYQPRHSYTQDLTECKMLAQQTAGYALEETIKGGLLGGAIGAAAGAAIGAVLGRAGKGAAVGAAAGGIGGGTYRGFSADQKYKQAYAACMRNRGYNVLN